MPISTGLYGASSKKSSSWYDELPATPAPSLPTYSEGQASAPKQDGTDPFNGPGSIDFDLTNPSDAANKAAKETGDIFTGLKAFLFGTDQPDVTGKHGGILGDVPVVGAGTRFVSEAASNVAGLGGLTKAVVGGTINTVGGALEHASLGVSDDLRNKFNALPDDFSGKQEALKQIAAEGGNEGIGSAAAHYMSSALAKYDEEKAPDHPNLWSGLFVENASLADTVTNLFGGLGASERAAERLVAGAGRPGAGGMNQLQMVMAVGDGNARWTSDDPGLTPVEQIAYQNYKSGKWTETQALDWLASHGAGFTHNKALEIAGTMAMDPLNVASLGAAAIAKLGETGVQLLRAERAAQGLLATAKTTEEVAEATRAVELARAGIKAGEAGDAIAARNVLGQIAKQTWTGNTARAFGHVYEAMAGTSIGRMAKITRTIIDPLHAWGASPRAQAAIEEGSREVSKAVVAAHGYQHHVSLVHELGTTAGMGEQWVKEYEQGLAIYAGNALRRVAGRRYRDTQLLRGVGLDLIEKAPGEAIKDAMQNVRKSTVRSLEEEASGFIRYSWGEPELENLGRRLEVLWGGRTADEWVSTLRNMNNEQRSLLHAATYGTAVRKLHDAREAVLAAGDAGNFADRLGDLILINRQTLTDLGAEGLLKRLGETPDLEGKLALIEEYKRAYPELRNFVSDPTSAAETVSDFIDFVERRKNFLPAQIRDAERAGLPKALAEFDSLITPSSNPSDAIFTIGFRPKPEFLWGIESDSEGVLRVVGDPWFDQVSDGLLGYSGVHELAYNAAGKPIPGLVQRAIRGMDSFEAAGRTIFHGVSGKMVTNAAHGRFVANVLKQVESAGVSEDQVEALWRALMKRVDDADDISGMRGLSAGSMWDAAREVTAGWPSNTGLGPRELLVQVLRAYDGDLRTIGLTQKLSGRVKLMLGSATGRNFAGQISEQLWPTLKFRLNPMFQLQEKVEPWVLNAQRGASVTLGRTPNEADRATAALYRNFLEKNLVNLADEDIAELSAKFDIGKHMEWASLDRGSKISVLRSRLDGLLDVQGTKRLNMMRTFRKGLGAEMRRTWEEAGMGREWNDMLDHYRALHGLVDEDDFAVHLAAENIAANDVLVQRMMDKTGKLVGWRAEFENAISTGQWAAPQTLGELRALNLDRMVQRIGLTATNGRDIKTSMELREALAAGTMDMKQVKRELRILGAHPDYIQRVENAYSFSWPKFWQDAKEAFGLSDDEARRIANFYARMAEKRGMTPVEYMSQVYSPHIKRAEEGALVGSLGSVMPFIERGRNVERPDLAVLAGTRGVSTAEEMYLQMSRVMAQHLDPSAKRNILLALVGDEHEPGVFRDRLADFADSPADTIDEIEEVWNSGATDAFAQRIMRYAQGAPGTSAHTVIAPNATPELAKIREAAAQWKAETGRPNHLARVIYNDDPALRQQVADAVDQLPVWRIGPTEEMLNRRLLMQDIDNISGWSASNIHNYDTGALLRGLPKAVQESYEQYIAETRDLYRYIRDEMHVNVQMYHPSAARPVPYADADALRSDLARGRIVVPDSGYWQPVGSQEDAFMARVVRDVFGYGQEAVPFGSDHAAAAAASMYRDTTRGIAWTEGFGAHAWETSSQRVVPHVELDPRTIEGMEARWGSHTRHHVQTSGPTVPGTTASTHVMTTRRFGDGVRSAAPEVQNELFEHYNYLRNHFPGVDLEAIEIRPIDAGEYAVTSTHQGHTTITLNHDVGWQNDPAVRDAVRQQRLADWASSGDQGMPTQPWYPYPDAGGVLKHVGATPQSDLYHEFGHVVDVSVHKFDAAGKPLKDEYRNARMTKLVDEFWNSNARLTISQYASHTYVGEWERADAFAELFDLTFNPEFASDLPIIQMQNPELYRFVERFRNELRREGVFKETLPTVTDHPFAGRTIADANANGANIAFEHRVGALPQDVVDALTQGFVGTGRYAESNPDIARFAAYMRDTARDLINTVFEGRPNTAFVHLNNASAADLILNDLSGMPNIEGVAYDFSQAKLWDAAVASMAEKWQDAFRLQYFAQNRSMLQRSINHPMFGLYPASYMWGKIGPELIKFIALQPFGVKSGVMLRSLADMQQAVGVQRTYDPEFEKKIDEIGHSAALSFLGYLLPATPWSVPASYPSWLRDIAKQGLDMEAATATNKPMSDINWVTPITSTLKKLVPMTTQAPWIARAYEEAAGVKRPPQTDEAAYAEWLQAQMEKYGGRTPEEAQAAMEANQPEQPMNAHAADFSIATPASDMGPVLQDSMRELQSLFGGG